MMEPMVEKMLPDDSFLLHRQDEKEKKHPEPDLADCPSEARREKLGDRGKKYTEWPDANLTMLSISVYIGVE